MSDIVFNTAMNFVLPQEGGFVDNPADHGGMTNFGITEALWKQYGGSGTVATITEEQATDVYQKMVWQPAYCDSLAAPLAVVHMDWAVNHGVLAANRNLQQLVGAVQDSVIGPMTIATIGTYNMTVLVEMYLGFRVAWYRQFSQKEPSQLQFLNGWVNRVIALRKFLENRYGTDF